MNFKDSRVDTFAHRLDLAMRNSNINQIELAEKTKLYEKSISQSLINKYLKGKAFARQNNIYILCKILNVDEAWMMGFDVPMERTPDQYRQQENTEIYVAQDDAMYPLLDIGDIAFVYKQNNIDETNPSSNNAGTYLIEINTQQTIRRFIESQDKTYYTLQGMNMTCKPINIKKEELQDKLIILGKVIKVENSSAFK